MKVDGYRVATRGGSLVIIGVVPMAEYGILNFENWGYGEISAQQKKNPTQPADCKHNLTILPKQKMKVIFV